MKLYAHRGNLNGQNKTLENTYSYIQEALEKGFCVEIDVWYIPEKNQFWLGHDRPTNLITKEFLEDDRLLVHAKDLVTFERISKHSNIHSFYQDADSVSVTSWGKNVYHQSTNLLDYNSDQIIVDISGTKICDECPCYGIISDYVTSYSQYLPTKKDIFKLLILDVDGVMTDGSKTYDSEHNIISKRYCDKDFTAIKRFLSANVPVVLLSGCSFNRGMAKARGLAFYDVKKVSNQLDKYAAALEWGIFKTYSVEPKDVGYVGDDYYDLSLLEIVGYPYCPADAAEVVKQSAITLSKNGGCGVVEALYEKVRGSLNVRFPYE